MFQVPGSRFHIPYSRGATSTGIREAPCVARGRISQVLLYQYAEKAQYIRSSPYHALIYRCINSRPLFFRQVAGQNDFISGSNAQYHHRWHSELQITEMLVPSTPLDTPRHPSTASQQTSLALLFLCGQISHRAHAPLDIKMSSLGRLMQISPKALAALLPVHSHY